MNAIPSKVVFLVSAEVGAFLGMGVWIFYTMRTIITATKKNSWRGFKEL